MIDSFRQALDKRTPKAEIIPAEDFAKKDIAEVRVYIASRLNINDPNFDINTPDKQDQSLLGTAIFFDFYMLEILLSSGNRLDLKLPEDLASILSCAGFYLERYQSQRNVTVVDIYKLFLKYRNEINFNLNTQKTD